MNHAVLVVHHYPTFTLFLQAHPWKGSFWDFPVLLSAGFQVPPWFWGDNAFFWNHLTPADELPEVCPENVQIVTLVVHRVSLLPFVILNLIPLSAPRPSSICPCFLHLLDLTFPTVPQESPAILVTYRHHVHFQTSLFSSRKALVHLKLTFLVLHFE